MVDTTSATTFFLASSIADLQQALGWFGAECKAIGMRISSSKSEARVLSWKWVDCPSQAKGESLPQVEVLKYLMVLFKSECRGDRELDRWIGAASAVLWMLNQSVEVKRELSQKANLLVHLHPHPHQRSQSRLVTKVTDRVRSSDIWEGVRGEPLLVHIERSQLMWFRYIVRMPPERLPERFSGRDPPGHTQDMLEGIIVFAWPGNASVSSQKSWWSNTLLRFLLP